MEPWQPIPEWSLLAPYAQQPHYADHFCVSVAAEVSIEQWTAAFFPSRPTGPTAGHCFALARRTCAGFGKTTRGIAQILDA